MSIRRDGAKVRNDRAMEVRLKNSMAIVVQGNRGGSRAFGDIAVLSCHLGWRGYQSSSEGEKKWKKDCKFITSCSNKMDPLGAILC